MSQHSSPELKYLRPHSPTPQLAIHGRGPISSPEEQELQEEHTTVQNSTTRAAYHASLIPHAQGLFNSPLGETIQAFRDCPPTRTMSLHNPQLHGAQPSYRAIELSPSLEPVLIPLHVHNTTPLLPYTRDNMPPPPLTLSTDKETLVEADNHPGPEWHINYDQQGIRYMFTMSSDNPDIQELTKYLWIDTNGGDPILCATMGRGQLVHKSPLHAKPRKTP
jgi:hypothetical protein